MSEFNNEEEYKGINKTQKEEFSPGAKNEVIPEYGVSKKAKIGAKVASITLTVVGASLILGSIISYSFLNISTTAVIEQFDLVAETTSINYDIVIRDMNVETLTLKLHNNFISQSKTIIMGQNVGSFIDLKPGMQYEVSLLEKNVVVKTTFITTLYE